MKGVNRKLLYLLSCCILIVLLFAVLHKENKNILEKISEVCGSGKKQIQLRDVTDFDWDTIYVQYGLSTEFLFEDYNLSEVDNVTETYGVSLYFVKEGKVVYFENHEDYLKAPQVLTATSEKTTMPIYVEFDDLNFENHRGKRDRISITGIFYNDTSLSVGIRETPFGYKLCTLTGGIGDISGIYSGAGKKNSNK